MKVRHLAPLAALLAAAAHADSITDWNQKAGDWIAEAKLGTPPAVRVMAFAQTAAFDAVLAADLKGASLDAAVAASQRVAFTKLLPAQQAGVDAAYQAALAAITDGPAKNAGIAAGEAAAAALFAARGDDGAATPESYRPHASPGAYVPTATPAVPQWQQRKPWLMTSPSQLRPEAPPALTSETWARDFNEVKLLGAKNSKARSAEQTEIARFWEYSLPAIYHGMLRSVALQPGRNLVQNARLFAASAQAMDDAMIAVFDAKYHYNFWRPATAIRNADRDGHDGTERDASWTPFIDTPMHPEYPSAHSILAASVGAVVQAERGEGKPVAQTPLTTSSPSAKGATRHWARVDDFVREVGNARVWDGVHYRFSTEVGAAMGRRIGELAAARWLAPQP